MNLVLCTSTLVSQIWFDQLNHYLNDKKISDNWPLLVVILCLAVAIEFVRVQYMLL